MSLATRCSACGTTFRVVEDQLKVSGGWVRCGSCNEVFNAAERLVSARSEISSERDQMAPSAATAESGPPDEAVTEAVGGGAIAFDKEDGRADGRSSAESQVGSSSESVSAEDAQSEMAQEGESLPGGFPSDSVQADHGIAGAQKDEPSEPGAGSDAVASAGADGRIPTVASVGVDASTAAAAEFASTNAQQAGDRSNVHAFSDADDLANTADSSGVAGLADAADSSNARAPRERADAFDTTIVAESRLPTDTPASEPAVVQPHGGGKDGDAFRDSRIDAHLFGVRRGGSRRVKATHLDERDRLDFSDARFDSDLMAFEDEALSDAPADAPNAAAPEAALPAEGVAPAFMRRGESTTRWRHPKVRLGLALGAIALTACLAVQWVHHFRDAAAAQWPGLRAALTQWCAVAGCSIEAPRRIDAISVESTALAKAPGTEAFRLAVGLRNRDRVPVALPWIDLSLTDGAGRLVARKALAAAEFRPGSLVLQPGSDIVLQTLLSARNLQVTGYTVEVFYP